MQPIVPFGAQLLTALLHGGADVAARAADFDCAGT